MSTHTGHQLLYQCDQHMAQQMKQHKSKVHHALQNAVNRKVRIETVDQEVLEGTLVGYDKTFIYISMEPVQSRGYYPYPGGYYPPRPRPPYYPSNVILPLALFDLLTLTLLLV
ncbi:hypothetical protein JJQ72_03750 [Paenibacillus sp. F411]|uniref:Uncharacterized protein n=1 Tax=Paenibacillus algicola TaxID=2565926 RepID=A0A4P8XMB3_9BACL|nr:MULTISPECIES: hypothetical protein [Paenibacillus]MBO2943095.1 hypothetical protein [Paenibacillus sp. F411]QCT02651.1 hypothetical protein E6C60_1936 [Paenibacillus algicola]